jgi:protein-tyrosine-phosphatase
VDKKKVLFVCVENSCRSQIAEGLARQLGGDVLEPWSAGSKPSGKVNPTAAALMKGRGIDLGAHRSKGLSDLPAGPWDYVVTMGCGDACPFVPSRAKADWGIPDPKNMPHEEFLKVIGRIEAKVIQLIGAVKAGAGR